MPKTITIANVSSNFEREPLIRPFGFKGGYQTEIWQSAALLESASGQHALGRCTQGVLWSDAHVFAHHSETGGSALMYAMTERALQMLKGQRASGTTSTPTARKSPHTRSCARPSR